jgi:hypothetical protein
MWGTRDAVVRREDGGWAVVEMTDDGQFVERTEDGQFVERTEDGQFVERMQDGLLLDGFFGCLRGSGALDDEDGLVVDEGLVSVGAK